MGERRRGDPSHNCAWADRHNRGGKKIAGLDRLGAKPEKLARARTDLRTMQDYLGHRDPKHTAHYTRVAGHRFEGLRK
jgi:hypothetical protein